ncbi:cell wall-associated NlpC family hydrolase [Dysgonomonas sp. PFB1-18]|uniref:C40 family peptidase n=1 Tax=unclassified Dysgonomonas TaxID=2630389 RepID=UPI002475352D|nr:MULTISPECIES: C40 family peptidase [unclassified Dysgonomonas]MDH6307826.1 cell wall-associated NlpC family hydrolase [Dysgonomonas sp. PF1-14]MDH6337744.1 cell wall-associated NlpC family hydrolase [Dysgonomonas sp. PF1-16]MDH6378968.1 cell wall-associated NlpC family hydrolase [Dysgonomonas sp. PFB1-18]MDH6396603.1 cell wall-associated NlpC family hydrolase [Dysgonomonas sp. PF1-23]
MSTQPNLLRIPSLLLLILMAFAPISATNPKQSKTGKKKPKAKSSMTTKKVTVVQSTDNVEMTTDDGATVSLPRVDQTLIDQSSIISDAADDLFADADINKSLEALKEKLMMQKEMQELSSRLGITITDAAHIDLYREVADWLGTRYRRGGMSRQAVDCSGFTNLVYKNVYNQQLDRVSTTIANNLKESVAKEDLIPGDMVFFSTFNKKYINHVGVYIGEGKFIHASIKKGVIVSSLAEGYYSKAWRKGGRNN